MDTIPNECTKVIETKDGPICGYIHRTNQGTYYKFKKIPYAKPPIGTLRFRPPFPVEPWTELLDCTQDTPLPLGQIVDKIDGSEDCLYLDISTPNINPDNPMPVMFWVGSLYFFIYLDNLYDPTLINNQNIVFVRCGFRLGPLGFLSNNECTAPGNSGLKDIVMALRWVQKNISSFGGDPNSVTLFGNSTGGMMVHFLMLSPMANGLFHKAIVQNSNVISRWSIDKNPIQSMMKLAKLLGITKTDKIEVFEELKTMDAKVLLSATKALHLREIKNQDLEIFDSVFKPVIEEEFEGQPFFINKSPEQILKSGKFNKMPIIIGSNIIANTFHEFISSEYVDKLEKNPALLVPKSVATLDDISAKKTGQQIMDYYLKGSAKEHLKTHIMQIFIDFYYLYHINKTVKLHSQVSPDYPIFYYIVNSMGEWSAPDSYKSYFLANLAEIPFLFHIKSKDSSYYEGTLDSAIARKRIVKMWTNFAKYGNPTPDENDSDLKITWDSVSNENKLNYLSINHDLTKGINPYNERIKFWEELLGNCCLLKTLIYFNDGGITR